jgi:hypothetical protein
MSHKLKEGPGKDIDLAEVSAPQWDVIERVLRDPTVAEKLKDPEFVSRLIKAAKEASTPPGEKDLDIKKKDQSLPTQTPEPPPHDPEANRREPMETQAKPADVSPPPTIPPHERAPDFGEPSAAAPPPVTPAEPAWRQKLVETLDDLRDEDGPLGDSPVWRDALHDLSVATLDSIDPDTAGSLRGDDLDRRFGQWNDSLREVNGWTQPLRETFRDLGLPSWSSIRPARAGSGWGRMPSFGSPNIGAPTVKAAGSGAAVAWVVLAAALAGLLWQVAKHYRKSLAVGVDEAWRLGPWPVPPGGVASRDEIVRAFEYLALLHFGRESRSWNHREIASRLGGNEPARRQAAAELADVYERARYAPAAEPIAEQALLAARRALCLLAGVACG